MGVPPPDPPCFSARAGGQHESPNLEESPQISGGTLPCLLQSGEGFFLEFDFAYKLRIGGARAELLHPLRLRVATARAPDA